MDYFDYNAGPYKLHIIKNNFFKTIKIKVNFKCELKKDEITIRNLLRLALINSTKKYPSERLMNIESENLYDLVYGSSGVITGNYSVLTFSIDFINKKYCLEDNLESSIDFLCNILFEPNVLGKKFESTNFLLVKERLKNAIESEIENPKSYALNRLLEEMDKKANYSFDPNGYLSDLEKINEQNLYQCYLDMLNKNIVDIFVIGDVDVDEIKELINKKFTINTIKKPCSTHFIEHKKFRSRVKTICEEKSISQSKLYLGFKCDNVSNFERQYVSSIYSFILGGGPDSKLFKSVREKNSLCYYINSSYRPVSNLLIITSGIDRTNFKKAVNLVKKEIKNMINGDFDDDDIKKAISTYLNINESLLDSPNGIIKNYVSHEYLGFDLIEDRKKNILKVTKDDIISFAKKIHLDTIYLLESGDDSAA